jgi:hypothetical protein
MALLAHLLPLLLLAGASASCPDITKFRSKAVAASFDPERLTGFWYEHAYIDIAQVGSSCQTLNSTYDAASGLISMPFAVKYGPIPFTIVELYTPFPNATSTKAYVTQGEKERGRGREGERERGRERGGEREERDVYVCVYYAGAAPPIGTACVCAIRATTVWSVWRPPCVYCVCAFPTFTHLSLIALIPVIHRLGLTRRNLYSMFLHLIHTSLRPPLTPTPHPPPPTPPPPRRYYNKRADEPGGKFLLLPTVFVDAQSTAVDGYSVGGSDDESAGLVTTPYDIVTVYSCKNVLGKSVTELVFATKNKTISATLLGQMQATARGLGITYEDTALKTVDHSKC